MDQGLEKTRRVSQSSVRGRCGAGWRRKSPSLRRPLAPQCMKVANRTGLKWKDAVAAHEGAAAQADVGPDGAKLQRRRCSGARRPRDAQDEFGARA